MLSKKYVMKKYSQIDMDFTMVGSTLKHNFMEFMPNFKQLHQLHIAFSYIFDVITPSDYFIF